MPNLKVSIPANRSQRIFQYLLATAVICTSQVSMAGDNLIGQWYLQPKLTLDNPVRSPSNIKHQTISIGQTLDKRINLEISLLSDKVNYGADNKGILIDGRYYLKSYGQFSPYIAGGISSTRNARRLDTSFQIPTTNFGLGFEHTLKENGTKIQANIRYFMDDNKQTNTLNDVSVNDWTMQFGVSIPLNVDLFK